MLLMSAFVVAGTLHGAAESDADSKAVLAAMNALSQALIHRDGPALDRLLNDDLTYVHSGGQFESKADVIKANTTGKSVIEKIEFTNPKVRVHGNTALVTGRVDLWHSPTNIVPMDVLHVWVKSSGQWRLVARQATRLPK
jgi:ketosteroid isomerase-like protein